MCNRFNARLFAREGAQVVMADIAAEAGEETAQLAGYGASFVHTLPRHEAVLSVLGGTLSGFRRRCPLTQGSSVLATVGFAMESRLNSKTTLIRLAFCQHGRHNCQQSNDSP